MDKDSLQWSYRLLLSSAVIYALGVLITPTRHVLQDVSYILAFSALLFLAEYHKTAKSRMLYWTVVGIWLIVIAYALVSLSGISDALGMVYLYATAFVFVGVPSSTFLFSWAMRDLCMTHSLTRAASSWTISMWLTGICYATPAAVYLVGMVLLIARVITSFGLHLRPNTSSPVADAISTILILAIMFVPLAFMFVAFHKTIEDVSSAPKITQEVDNDQSRTNVL